MDSRSYYLDYNATSPLGSQVKAWLHRGDFFEANPASQHSFGKAAAKQIHQTEQFLFQTFALSEKDYFLFFHSGATEGIATFCHSLAELKKNGSYEIFLFHSPIDHPALLEQKKAPWGNKINFVELPINESGEIELTHFMADYQNIKKAHPNAIIGLHYLWVHNETGVVSPLSHLEALPDDVLISVDAVQAPGKIAQWMKLFTRAHFYTFSGHKFGALKGIGFSFVSQSFSFSPLIRGGGQQKNRRSGTQSAMQIYSLELALGEITKIEVSSLQSQLKSLETHLTQLLEGKGELIYRRAKHKNHNTLYFFLYGLSSDISLALFDQHGLAISAGSACSSGAAKPSQTLITAGKEAFAKNGLRMSLGFEVLSNKDFAVLLDRLTLVFSKIPKI